MLAGIKIKQNRIRRYMVSGIVAAVLLCAFLLCPERAMADTVPRLSDQKFDEALGEIKEKYDKDVSRTQAERNPYIKKRLILSSDDRNLDPEDYGAVDAIQDQDGNYILQFETYAKARRAEAKLEKESATECVEPDVVLFASSDSSGSVQAASSASWNVSMIGMDTYCAWVQSQNSSASATVAVLDTGISFSHPLLSDRILSSKAKSFVSGYPVNEDDSSRILTHGTHVAGIVVQCTPGLQVNLLPVRVLDGYGAGDMSNLLSGIDYAVKNGADVINISIDGSAGMRSMLLETAIASAIKSGVTVVVSAGNSNIEISSNYVVPAYISDCIVVGAVDSSKNRAGYSNYGDTVDVVAPGSMISSSYISSTGKLDYVNMSGTSMATPHVSAMAAVVGMACSSYTPKQIEAFIVQNACDLGTTGKDDYYGYGLAYMGAGEELESDAQTITSLETDTSLQTAAQQSAAAQESESESSADTTEQEPVTISKTPARVKTKVKKNKVTISWKKIKKTKKTKALLKQIKYIQVQYSTDPTFSQGVKTRKVSKKKTKVTLKLKRQKTYYVRVRYVGSTGVSAWTSFRRVRTK